MKKIILYVLIFLAAFLLLAYIVVFVPFSSLYEKGPKAYYRVQEGAIEVFALKNGQVRSLLAYLRPGESLVAPMVSDASLKIPFWLSWIEPVIINGVGRAKYFMYREGKKSKYNQFTVGYSNLTIRKGFVRELERGGIFKDILLDFVPGGFSFFAQAAGVPFSTRGSVSVPGTGDDKLLLHLKSLKIGPATMPEKFLRAVENIFADAYVNAGSFPIRLIRITFKDKTVVMSFRKLAGGDTGTLN